MEFYSKIFLNVLFYFSCRPAERDLRILASVSLGVGSGFMQNKGFCLRNVSLRMI